jgi:hypothetical protein
LSYRVAGADIELASDSESYSEITTAGETPEWRERRRNSWRRGEWYCAIEASYRLTGDADAFTLEETLHASEGGKEIFARTSTTTIKRDLL